MDERRASSGTFRKVVTFQLALLCGLLGLWAFNRIAHSGRTPEAAAARGDEPAMTVPDDASAQPPTAPVAIRPVTGAPAPAPAETPMLGPLRKPVILIEKSKQRLIVYDDQDVVAVYPAAVGGNLGDKESEGDFRTPEGEFYVCVKNPASQYVLSLGLSYPGFKDAERGLRQNLITRSEYDQIVYAIRNGLQPPWDTALGGQIMIHGERRGGRTTQGCIALENDVIRQLYAVIPLGTPVVIRP